MVRHFSALLLLSVLSLGLLAGPHPCKASHQERESAHSSCHEADSSSKVPEVQQDSPSQSDPCCSTFCRHACQMTAVAEADQAIVDIAPVSQAVVDASDFGLPLFAHPIDHVPLA